MKGKSVRQLIEKGEAFWYKGNFKNALTTFQSINLNDTNTAEKAEVLNNLGVLQKKFGNYLEAEKNFKDSLFYREQINNEPFEQYIHTLNNLAMVKKFLGNYKEAEKIYLSTIKLFEEDIKYTEEYGNLLNNIGVFYLSLGVYANAEKYLNASQSIRLQNFGIESAYYMESLNNMAFLKRELKQYLEAEKLYLELIELMKKNNEETTMNYKKTLKNYSSTLLDSGKNSEAINILEKIIDDFRKDDLQNTYEFTAFLEEYARALKQLNEKETDKISSVYNEAIEILKSQNLTKTIQYSKVLSGKAEVLISNGEYENAFFLLKRTLEIQNDIMRSISLNFSEEEALQILNKIENESSMILNLLINHFHDDAYKITEIYEKIALRKSAIFEITTIQNLVIQNLESEVEKNSQLSTLLRKRMDLKSILAEKITQKKDYTKIKEEIEKLEKEIFIQIQSTNSVKNFQKIDLKKIIKKMKKNELILDFYHEKSNGTYLMFILNSEKLKIVEIGSFDEINQLIEHYRTLICKSEGLEKTDTEAKELYKIFFGFLKTEKIEIPERLIISTTGDISKLPFETLITEKDTYLIEETTVKYVSTIKEVGEGNTLNTQNITIITDPDYDYPEKQADTPLNNDEDETFERSFDQKNIHFKRLHGTKIEGERIAALMAKNKWLIKEHLCQKKAIDREIKKIENSAVIHIATHGFFKSNDYKINPLHQSGLVFTGINTLIANRQKLNSSQKEEIEDATLSAYDIINMNLDKTELLVLSACETGLGEYIPGNGIIGLQRAAFMAGVKSMIMTLWKIPDQTTVVLMENFYKKYLQTKNTETALRGAKLELIEELYEKNNCADPYIWGAFVHLDSRI